VVEARPEVKGSVNGLTICVRGRFGFEYVNNPERLKEPLIREGGEWHPLSWEKALEHLAKEFNRLQDKYGPRSLGFVCGSSLSCQEGYLLQRLARGLGTNNLAQGAGYVEDMVGPFKEALGWIGSTQPLSQLEQAELIFVLGARVTEAVPVMSYHLKRAVRNNQAGLIVVDPVWSELCEQAKHWVRPLPQGDGFMFIALMKILLEKGWVNRPKGGQRRGWRELDSYLEGVSLEKCAEWCGLEKDSLVRIASLLNSSSKTAFVIGRGLSNQRGASEALKALLDLYLLLGGAERHGLFPVYYESNAFGLGLMGVSGRYAPGFAADGRETGWAGINKVCGTPGPERPGLSLGEMLSRAETQDLRGLFLLHYETSFRIKA
jgi:formate dehydrogenase major subunit